MGELPASTREAEGVATCIVPLLFAHSPQNVIFVVRFGQFKDPLITLLLVSAGISVAMGQWDDAISITVVRG